MAEKVAAMARDVPPAIHQLLSDLLGDLGLAVVHCSGERRADLVLVFVASADDLERVAEVRRGSTAPILVVFPLADDALATRAVEGGGSAWYALDLPLWRLRAAVAGALAQARDAPS